MWAESLFDNTRSAIARSIEGIVHFMCTKVSRLLPCIASCGHIFMNSRLQDLITMQAQRARTSATPSSHRQT